jgi:Na+-transporting NADH:ubiquinone oxidoreductase subunit C
MNRIIRSVIFMFITALVFTTIVTVVKIANENRIERNRKIKLQRTIINVLGLNNGSGLSPDKISETYNRRIKEEKIGGRTIYTCYDDKGKTVTGYAFPVEGPGFWGPVYAMAAVNPEATKLLGVSFFRHSETPGLGGRISEKWFSDQFKGLSLKLTGSEKQYFYLTPEVEKERDNDLDAITGASRTSDAVETFLNRELKTVVNELRHKNPNE